MADSEAGQPRRLGPAPADGEPPNQWKTPLDRRWLASLLAECALARWGIRVGVRGDCASSGA